jgi:hypothetical protein
LFPKKALEKRMTKKMVSLLSLVFVLTLLACATYETRPVAARDAVDLRDTIAHQQKRIEDGVASGTLLRNEADILQGNLDWIRDRYSRLTADGLLTPREAQKLERMLGQNGKMITNKKSNPAKRLY